MSLLGIGASLLGGALFGGGGDSGGGGSRANVPELNQFDMENLDQYQLEQFEGNADLTNFNNQIGDLDLSNFDYNSNTSEYDNELPNLNQFNNTMGDLNLEQYNGQTNIEAGSLYDQMQSNAMNQLQGNNLGMSEEEISAYTDRLSDTLNEQRDEGVESVMNRMNSRGILGSTATNKGLSDVSENYSDALSRGQTDLFLNNEQMKRQQYNTAMGQGLGLSQYDTRLQQQSISNLMNAMNMNNQATQAEYNTNYQNQFNENQYNNQLSQQDYENQFNTWQANQQIDQSEYNTNYGNQFNEWQANNQVNQNRFSNQFNTWQANNNVTQQNLGNRLDVMGFNNNAIGNMYNMQTGERAYQDQQQANQWASAGTGFMMGNELGGGWGGALGGLAGYMFG